jgi:glucan biosynthesis protein C
MTEAGGERLHALDAVRGFALLGGVVFHATLSFMPGLPIWPTMDSDPSPTLALVFYVLHIFRMATFFLLAGFFARMLMQRRGVGGFVVDRLKRIALPLAVFWPIVISGILAALTWNAIIAAGGGAPPAPPPPQPLPAFPLTHLWFLYVLLILYVGALALRGLVVVVDGSGRLRERIDGLARTMLGFWSPVVLAAPIAVAFWFQEGWPMWFGIPTPDMSLIPNAPAIVAFGMAFGLGWLVQRQSDTVLDLWKRRWPFNLTLAVLATAACLAMVGTAPSIAIEPRGMLKGAYAGCYAIAIWSWTFAVIGLALRFLCGHSPFRRYLADASYWIYLLHMPIVIALQTAVAKLDWPWEPKFLIVLAGTMAVTLLSYQLLVRYSFIGAILNGRRPRRAPKTAAQLTGETA